MLVANISRCGLNLRTIRRIPFTFQYFKESLKNSTPHSRTMSSLFVKCFEGEDRVHVSLNLTTGDGGSGEAPKSKSFNLDRSKHEEVGKAIERLQMSVSKKLSKKPKKKKKSSEDSEAVPVPEDPGLSIQLLFDGQCIPSTTTNENAWVEGTVLRIGDQDIAVTYNPPSAKLENLPDVMLEGFPLFVACELQFCDMNECEFYWRTVEKKYVDAVKKEIAKSTLGITDAIKGLSYTPSTNDLDHHVLLISIPKHGNKVGQTEATLSKNAVTTGPGPLPFEKRHRHTSEKAKDGEFRVMSYNLLAEIYSTTDVAQTQLFSHCPAQFLDMGYRKQLFLKEIIGFNGDLLCFQEVDRSIFTYYLSPALESLGFSGLFKPKAGQIGEGCATFVHKSKFRVAKQMDIDLSEFLSQDPVCSDIWSAVCKMEPLKGKLETRSTILQVTVVESLERPGELVCVANTHLYFHPSACNTRLIQTATILRYLETVSQAYAFEGKKASVVLCGDFNSAPYLGVFQLVNAQFVPSDHADWKSAGPTEELCTLELSHTLPLASAYHTPPHPPPDYTNFTVGFVRVLDYIFYQDSSLELTSLVPMPEHADVVANIALPNVHFPSDHLSLVCDFKFKD